MAQTLAELRTYAAQLRSAIQEVSLNAATTVTIGDMTITRPTVASLRREYNATIMTINRRESGGKAAV